LTLTTVDDTLQVDDTQTYVVRKQKTTYKDRTAVKPGDQVLMDADDESMAQIGLRFGLACIRGYKQKAAPCQDDFCIVATSSSCFIGVFDGHGEMGHFLSNVAQASVTSTAQESLDAFRTAPEDAFKDALRKADAACKNSPGSEDSGTTATMCMITPEKITVGWLGDSHARVGRLRKKGDPASKLGDGARAEWILQPMTKAHRPSDLDEHRRIVNAGGRVDCPEGAGDEGRVYAKEEGGPGLAMSRSLGDLWAHRLGVSSEPDFKALTVKGFEFFCVGSDGVWDVLSDDEVAAIVGMNGRENPQTAADQIKALAWETWHRNTDGTYVDDISFYVTWLPFTF
jgi:serine/threonine protein phosphatase PrpC